LVIPVVNEELSYCNRSLPVIVKGTVLSITSEFITLLNEHNEMYKAKEVYTCRNKMCK
jgi:hypothetical protein